MKYAFIVTYGRSGSTLLTGLLNAYPGVVIRGENHNALYHSWRGVSELAGAARKHGAKGQIGASRPWLGIDQVDIEAYERATAKAFTDHVLRPPPGTRVLGFKEIRYGIEEMSDDDLEGFLSFLIRRFEDCLLIFNSRNLDATSSSGWFRGVPSARRYLELSENRLRKACERLHDHSVWIHYDDYIADPRALMPVLARLDLPFEEERVAATMAKRHSYTKQQQNRRAIIRQETMLSNAVVDYERGFRVAGGVDRKRRGLGWIRKLVHKPRES